MTPAINTAGRLCWMASRWPSDYLLCPKLKEHSSGIRFSSSSDAKIAAENWLNGQGCGFYQAGLNKLVLRSDKVINIFSTASVLDEGVGSVFRALHQKDMLKNSVFIFTSDNGGEVNKERDGQGSNYPLRGNKYTPWEGGIRLPAVIWSPLLNLSKPRIAQQLMHVSDWLPTLYTAA
ncbi:Arylsulfatase B, partial [Araneus ventricosus]